MHTAGLLCGVSHKTLGLGQKGLDLDIPTGQALLQVTRTHCSYAQRLSAAPRHTWGNWEASTKSYRQENWEASPGYEGLFSPPSHTCWTRESKEKPPILGLDFLPHSLTQHFITGFLEPRKRYCQAELTTGDIFWCTLWVPTWPMSYQVVPLVPPSPHKARLAGC